MTKKTEDDSRDAELCEPRLSHLAVFGVISALLHLLLMCRRGRSVRTEVTGETFLQYVFALLYVDLKTLSGVNQPSRNEHWAVCGSGKMEQKTHASVFLPCRRNLAPKEKENP